MCVFHTMWFAVSCVVIIMCSEAVEYVFLRYFEGVDSVCFS